MRRIKLVKDKRGIILMEAIIALAVIVIVMTALVTALVSALNSSTFSNEQTVATAYAQEGLDYARALKNSDFSSFEGLISTEHCFGANTTQIPGSCSLIDGKYERKIYVNSNGDDGRNGITNACEQDGSIFVASIVYWNDSKCSGSTKCHEVVLSSCFVNLNYIDLGP